MDKEKSNALYGRALTVGDVRNLLGKFPDNMPMHFAHELITFPVVGIEDTCFVTADGQKQKVCNILVDDDRCLVIDRKALRNG